MNPSSASDKAVGGIECHIFNSLSHMWHMYLSNEEAGLGLEGPQIMTQCERGSHQHMYHIHTHSYIHTYIHTYIQAYIHTYIRTYVRTYIRTYIHKYIHTH